MLPSMFVATTAWMANAPLRNHHLCAHAASPATPMMSAEAAAKAAWLSRNTPSWSPPGGFVGSVAQTAPAWGQAQAYVPPPNLVHAPIAHFSLDKLAPKGTRRSQGGLVDVGEPADFSRPLALDADGKAISWCEARVGRACTEGGWGLSSVPRQRASRVGAGLRVRRGWHGAPWLGDVVVLPKHWHGRWDITDDPVWVVHDHPDVPVRLMASSAPWSRRCGRVACCARAARRRRAASGAGARGPHHLQCGPDAGRRPLVPARQLCRRGAADGGDLLCHRRCLLLDERRRLGAPVRRRRHRRAAARLGGALGHHRARHQGVGRGRVSLSGRLLRASMGVRGREA